MNKQAWGKKNTRGRKAHALLPESILRNERKRMMPTGKASGPLGESGHE